MNAHDEGMRPPDCCGDAAAYVLGALEPAELAAFEAHLSVCAVCRDEVDEFRRVAGALPMAAPQYRPPERLRARVLSAVRDEQSKESRWVRRKPTGRARRALAAGGLATGMAAVAAALVLTLGGGGGTRVISAQVTGVSGSAEVRLADGRGEIVVRHMTPPPRGDIYEVWLKAPNQRIPSPTNVLFSVTRTGSAQVGLPDRLRGISQIMVTPEPAGGTQVPTHTPVIVATLT